VGQDGVAEGQVAAVDDESGRLRAHGLEGGIVITVN
jgi:hypothetical protein